MLSAHISGNAPCWVTTQAATGGPATMLIRWARSFQARARTAAPGPSRSPRSARTARIAGPPTDVADPTISPLRHRSGTERASSVAATATTRWPSACTPSTAARARPEVSRCRSRAAHHGDVRSAMPDEPATSPVAQTEPVCCRAIKGRATSVSRRPVQLTKVASRMRHRSLLTVTGCGRTPMSR